MSQSMPRAAGPIPMMLWATAAAVVVLYLGPTFLRVFRPPPDTYLDFVQEWLSARCYWAGEPVYLPQREAMLRRTGEDVAALEERPWNAHPPGAILVALPFGLIDDYRAAHLSWNLVTFGMFLTSIAIVVRELRIPWHYWSICPAAVLVIADNPVISQLWHAQLNFPLCFLLVLAWAAERRGYRTGAGIAVGLATAIKLFPGLLLVYYIASRAWRPALVVAITAAAVNVLALGLFGWDAFTTYIREVLPSLEVFRASWGNASLTGYVTRALRALGAPSLAPFLAVGCQLATLGAVALVAWRAREAGERDRAFALTVAAMPLISPIAWAYYFVLLLFPLLLLWQQLAGTRARVVYFLALVLLLIPEGLYPGLYGSIVPGSPDVGGLANHLPTPPDPGLCLIGLAPPTLALLGFFLLLAFGRFVPREPTEPTAVEPINGRS